MFLSKVEEFNLDIVNLNYDNLNETDNSKLFLKFYDIKNDYSEQINSELKLRKIDKKIKFLIPFIKNELVKIKDFKINSGRIFIFFKDGSRFSKEIPEIQTLLSEYFFVKKEDYFQNILLFYIKDKNLLDFIILYDALS